MSEKQEMTIEEIRQKQMAITDYIDSVCEKAGLRYSLSYGTLLGAVRHKGFIPWDDDLDVMMVRKDYEAFISAVKADNNPNFRILYQENTWFPWVKIIAADTYIIERDDYHIKDYGVWVDVFPYDEVPDPDTKEAERFHKKYNTLLRMAKIRALGYENVKRRSSVSAFLFVITHTLLLPLPYNYLGKKVDKLAQKYNGKNTGFIAYSGSETVKQKSIRPEVFEGTVRLPFEDRQYACISRFDEYLTSIYGNYMTPPSKENQTTDHSYQAFFR